MVGSFPIKDNRRKYMYDYLNKYKKTMIIGGFIWLFLSSYILMKVLNSGVSVLGYTNSVLLDLYCITVAIMGVACLLGMGVVKLFLMAFKIDRSKSVIWLYSAVNFTLVLLFDVLLEWNSIVVIIINLIVFNAFFQTRKFDDRVCIVSIVMEILSLIMYR